MNFSGERTLPSLYDRRAGFFALTAALFLHPCARAGESRLLPRSPDVPAAGAQSRILNDYSFAVYSSLAKFDFGPALNLGERYLDPKELEAVVSVLEEARTLHPIEIRAAVSYQASVRTPLSRDDLGEDWDYLSPGEIRPILQFLRAHPDVPLEALGAAAASEESSEKRNQWAPMGLTALHLNPYVFPSIARLLARHSDANFDQVSGYASKVLILNAHRPEWEQGKPPKNYRKVLLELGSVFSITRAAQQEAARDWLARKDYSSNAGLRAEAFSAYGKIADGSDLFYPKAWRREARRRCKALSRLLFREPGSSAQRDQGPFLAHPGDLGVHTPPTIASDEGLALMRSLYTDKEILQLSQGKEWDLYDPIHSPEGNPLPSGKIPEAIVRREARKAEPFLRSHFTQLIRETGLTFPRFLSLWKEGSLPWDSLSGSLHAPIDRDGLSTYGWDFDLPSTTSLLVSGYLTEKTWTDALFGRPRRLKIVLGGTLAREIIDVCRKIETSLRAAARLAHVYDVEGWIRSWDVQVVGYSIETSALVAAGQKVRSALSALQRGWVRLEYIDLLDRRQIGRMILEAPDVVFTVKSLMLSKYEYGDSLPSSWDDREDRYRLYLDAVLASLPEGGLFVIERRDNHLADRPLLGFIRIPPPHGNHGGSGVYLKGDYSSAIPLSLLGGMNNMRTERRLHLAWRHFLKGNIEKAAWRLYRIYRQSVFDGFISRVLEPNLAILNTFLESSPAGPGAAAIGALAGVLAESRSVMSEEISFRRKFEAAIREIPVWDGPVRERKQTP